MSQTSLESNVKQISDLVQDLINCDDEDIAYFGHLIVGNLRQASIAIDEYKTSPSYDHSEVKEARYA